MSIYPNFLLNKKSTNIEHHTIKGYNVGCDLIKLEAFSKDKETITAMTSILN